MDTAGIIHVAPFRLILWLCSRPQSICNPNAALVKMGRSITTNTRKRDFSHVWRMPGEMLSSSHRAPSSAIFFTKAFLKRPEGPQTPSPVGDVSNSQSHREVETMQAYIVEFASRRPVSVFPYRIYNTTETSLLDPALVSILNPPTPIVFAQL